MPSVYPEAHWKQFGSWLRQQRRDADMTQAQVAKKAEMSEMQLARIEKGESGTKRETAIAIAKAIGIDVAETLNKAGWVIHEDVKPDNVLIIPPFQKRQKKVTEFLRSLEALGDFEFGIDWAALDHYTDEDLQELLERIKADVEITVRRKNK